MSRHFRLIALFYCLIGVCAYGNVKTTIYIKNQSDFEQITDHVKESIKSGQTEIYVIFPRKQAFVAKEKHILLGWLNAPNTSIHIEGNGCVLLPEGKEYHQGDTYEGTFSYDNSLMYNNEDVPVWSHYSYAKGLVEVVNGKTCRIKLKKSVDKNLDLINTYILLPEWCQSDIYKVTRIEGEYIYFAVDWIKKSYNGGYLVNDDYSYGGKQIRYKLCNIGADNVFDIQNGKVSLPNGVKYVRQGQIHNFLTIQSSQFKSVTISGLEFRGNSFSDSQPAVFVCDTQCNSIIIHNCKFNGLHSTAIAIESTANVTVENNSFKDCHYYGVCSDNRSKSTVIKNNTFETMGKRMTCSFCITCSGVDYYVANNVIKDFGYGGIGVGVWHGNEQDYPSNGIVEKNELFYTKDYLQNVDNNCIMDGGAVYLWTKNDGAIIRNNYIHDISGAMDNRGIFCDDGARNFVIENNVITNIYNSYCIDSRRVAVMEPQIGPTNVNNVIRNNVVDGKIRFVGREAVDNGCEYGTNYYLVDQSGKLPLRNIENATKTDEDVALIYTGMKKGRIGLDSKSYRRMKKSPVWKKVKQRLVRN